MMRQRFLTSPVPPRTAHAHDRLFRRPLGWLAGLSVFDLAFCAAFWAWSLVTVAPWLRPLPAGAPIVLFYSSYEPDREKRIAAAIEAYREHGARPILSVGGSRPEQRRFGAEEVAAELVRRGIPAEMVRSETLSFDTGTNIEAALRLANGASAFVLIGDRLHLLRIVRELRRLAPAVMPVAYILAGPERPVEIWWRLHYEAIAWASMLLPDSMRLRLIRLVRA